MDRHGVARPCVFDRSAGAMDPRGGAGFHSRARSASSFGWFSTTSPLKEVGARDVTGAVEVLDAAVVGPAEPRAAIYEVGEQIDAV